MPFRLDTGLRFDAHVRLDAPTGPVIPQKGKKHHMQNLHDYFVIAFADPNLALTRQLSFGSRALGRMSTNNPGNFLDDVIAELTSALGDAETCVTDVGVKAAIQKAKTDAKDGFRLALPTHIRRIYNSVAGVYGDPSGELIECFPQGRTPFRDCKDEELNNKLAGLVAALANKTVDAGIKTLAQTQLTNWNTIYGAQGAAKDVVNDTQEVREQKRFALAVALHKAVLTVSLQYPGDFNKCDYYFPQQLLRRPTPRTVPEKAVLTADPFNSTTRKATLHASADGAEEIRIERRMSGESDWSPIATVASPDGLADYEDTLMANGSFEYRAIGLKGSAEGEASHTLVVVAA